jgi:hypothetical protein
VIRSGAIVALLPYLATAAFVLADVIGAIVGLFRDARKPRYIPPEVTGEKQAIEHWRKRGGRQ